MHYKTRCRKPNLLGYVGRVLSPTAIEPFSDLFTRLLTERGLTARSFAKSAGVAWSFVHRIQKGKHPPPWDRIETWAELLDLSARECRTFVDAARWAHVPNYVRPWLAQRFKIK